MALERDLGQSERMASVDQTEARSRTQKLSGPDRSSALRCPQAAAVAGPARRQRWLINLIMAAIGVLFLLPLAWLIVAAFNPEAGPGLTAPHASLANFASAISTGAGRDILKLRKKEGSE